jgi:membrane AbrB-like protein
MPQRAATRHFTNIDIRAIRRTAVALLIGFAGGAVFAYAGLPLPWMLGAMAATMGASLAGTDIALPNTIRKPMIGVVGVTLGSAFTPDRLTGMGDWLPSLAVLPVYVATIGCLILFYLRRFAIFDGKTAFFAATPGGLSEMVILSDQQGGDMRSVALFHSARLVLIVFSIPIATNFLVDLEPVSSIESDGEPPGIDQLLILTGALIVGWFLAARVKLPSPSFMGPLFLSSAIHLAGLTHASPPFIIVAAAQLAIGTSVGCRFSGVPLRLILKTLTIGAGGAFLMFLVTLLFAVGLAYATGSQLALLLLAFIPGGFPEMSLIALGMGFDPAFVVTHHGMRVLFIVAFALPIFAWLSRRGWFERHWPKAGGSQGSVPDKSDHLP